MVGYRESKYSYNDPMDDWEDKMIRSQKAGGSRVLKEGYVGLLRKIFTGGKPMPKTNPEHPDFWQTVPKYEDGGIPQEVYQGIQSERRRNLEKTRGKGSKGFKTRK
jgi:hypothetical protein